MKIVTSTRICCELAFIKNRPKAYKTKTISINAAQSAAQQ